MRSNNKSSLNKSHSNIEIDEDFKNRLGLVHIEIEKLKKRKKPLYIYIFLYVIIGCALIITIIGFGLLWTAYSKLKQYVNESKYVKDEKNRMDAFLSKHQIEYSCNVEFGEKYHGNQDVIVELKSNSSLLKDSKMTLQI